MENINYTYIYALIDPRTDEIRYIGKADDPFKRLKGHLKFSRLGCNSHKNNWIKSLIKIGLIPALKILEKVPYSEWEQKEQHYIKLFKSNLTNLTDGGEGPSGIKISENVRHGDKVFKVIAE